MKRIGEALEKRRQEQYLRHAEENSMAVFLQPGKFESPYVTRAVQEIMEHYGGKLTLESVAEKLDISVTYLNKKLKEETSSICSTVTGSQKRANCSKPGGIRFTRFRT